MIEDLLFGGLDLIVRRVFEILHVFGVEHRSGGRKYAAGLSAALEHFQFAQSAFRPFATATQRLIYGLGGRSKPSLQNSERKTDSARALVVLERVGAVELLAHVVGNRLIKRLFRKSSG